MNLDELLDAAESVPAPFRDVRVCVNPAVAIKRAGLLDALERAKQEDQKNTDGDLRFGAEPVKVTDRTDAAAAALEAFDDEVLKSLVTLRFTRMDGDKWALLTSAYPMRLDVALDRHYGYNYDAVSEMAARKSGTQVDDAGQHELTDEQWTRLLKLLSGHDVSAIRDAVWSLNEYEPSKHVEALVKGFGAA